MIVIIIYSNAATVLYELAWTKLLNTFSLCEWEDNSNTYWPLRKQWIYLGVHIFVCIDRKNKRFQKKLVGQNTNKWTFTPTQLLQHYGATLTKISFVKAISSSRERPVLPFDTVLGGILLYFNWKQAFKLCNVFGVRISAAEVINIFCTFSRNLGADLIRMDLIDNAPFSGLTRLPNYLIIQFMPSSINMPRTAGSALTILVLVSLYLKMVTSAGKFL